MSTSIKDLFTQYKKNYKDWEELEKNLMKPTTREEWLDEFYKSMYVFQSIYDSNKYIMQELTDQFDNLSDKNAEMLFTELFSMYLEQYNDAEFFLYAAKKLLDFYTEANDITKSVSLCTIIQRSQLAVDYPEGKGPNFDLTYQKKGLEYVKHYKELDDSARTRIWVMYYNYIVRLGDFGIISLNDALDCYDRLMEISKQPDIVKMDENVPRIQDLKEYITQTMFIAIGLIHNADLHTKKRFYKYTKEYFEKNTNVLHSTYELPTELYACYLYNKYMEGVINIDEVFKNFYDYTNYKFQLVLSNSDVSQDEFIQCTNAVCYLTRLGQFLSGHEMIESALNSFIDFVQTKWVKSNLSHFDRMNEMLGRICLSLVSFDVVGVNKEKCITQLIVQRDIDVYIHSKITVEIAMALYREITEKNPDFFDEVKSIPPEQWKNFLYYCSMFHDIGKEKIMGTLIYKNRPLFEEESKRRKEHVKYGALALGMVKSTAKYAEVIKGHHVFFNEENSSDYEYDRSKTDLNPFTDILALAVYIEESTNRFWDFAKTSKKLSVILQEMANQKDLRFNGKLVDVLLNSKGLQKQIEKIVTAGRENIAFDVYHNWEIIQLSQDEEAMFEECSAQFEEFMKTRDIESYAPFKLQLEHLSKNSTNNVTKGKAMYKLMLYYFACGNYSDGFVLSAEVERLLKLTKHNELLAEFYYNMGNGAIVNGNEESALSYYLSCVSIANRTPGCDGIKNMSLLSIAAVFMEKYHYAKAKEYFDRCNIKNLPPDEQIRFLCMEGYCRTQLKDKVHVKSIRKKVTSLMEKHPELVIFPQYVYLAIFSAEIGDDEELEKNLSILRESELLSEDVIYYSDEMFKHIELLSSLKRYSEASSILDKYIGLCEGRNEFGNALTKLLNIKIDVMSNLSGLTEFAKYEKMLREAFYNSCVEEAHRFENIEKKLVSEIKLREEHDAILNNQELLEESVKKAQSDSEQKSQFLSSMSHEIRTPINAILGLNEMIMRESTDETILQYASDIQGAGKQLLGIINDVLDYSKIEAGKMEIVPQRYNISALINDIKNMLEPKLREKNLEFRVKCNPEIPDVLLGDDLRIKQILLNLLSNAYKYTKTGFVEFIIDYEKKDERTIDVSFSVADTGIGLKPEQIEKIANPFERFDLVQNRGIEGTGLGMSIVMKLLEQMESHLDIESEYGKGTKFSFELKQGVIEWHKLGKFDETRKHFVGSDAIKHPGAHSKLHAPNAKVLIVDDNAVNLKVASALLKRTGMQITTATGGYEALDLCAKNEYHIILLDHMMPEIDGIETLKRLKEAGGVNASIPTIALTANVVESADNFYIKSGFDALLTKPIDASKMEEIIASLLPEYLVE